jgi:hypothetical protein
MKAYDIPLKPQAQTFAIALNGTTYHLTLSWNTISLCWVLDIADEGDVAIIQGIPVVTGLDLLYQYQYLGIKGSLVVQTDYDPSVVPGYGSFGVDGHIYFVTG